MLCIDLVHDSMCELPITFNAVGITHLQLLRISMKALLHIVSDIKIMFGRSRSRRILIQK